MSFNSAEISTQDGRPLALYLLEWGQTEWCYTSADRDITYGVNNLGQPRVYLARAVSDSGMVQGGSTATDFTIDCPSDLPIVNLFRGTPPSETIWLTVRRMHFGEADAPVYWVGNVVNVKRVDSASGKLVGKPLTASFKRTGLRLCWTRECPHFLYDGGCKADPEAFRVDAEITAKTGNTVTVDTVGGMEDRYFTGGFVSWEVNDDGTIDRRMIEGHNGTVLTIFGLTDRMEIGDAVALYPGCNRSPTMCDEKFDNLANYGGYDFMPGETPFGTILF